jgi:hypothetical protein
MAHGVVTFVSWHPFITKNAILGYLRKVEIPKITFEQYDKQRNGFSL